AAPADPGRQGFCDVTNGFSERNPEVIWSIQFSYDPVQYSNTATSYNHVVFLSQYDGGAGGWAAGITRVLDDGRPFRRVRPTPCATAPGADCGKDNDALGRFGYAHYPSLKKFQDNGRTGGFNDLNGGKDRIVFRLGETYLIAAEAALGLGDGATAAANINVLR